MTQDKPSPSPMPGPLAADASASPTYRITLPEFEGPLDLLLHLCQTHGIDILNISVAFVAQKYIEYLELMENMAVEVAADYLVMAAHLAYLKSRELVPSPEPLEASEDGEDPLDPREELIRRLLEYQKYKHAAENLGNRPIEGRNVFIRGSVLQAEGEAGLAEHSVWKLIEHWAGTLKKAKPEYTHDVVMDRMSISDRINQIVDLLEAGNGMVRFEDLLGPNLAPAELRHKIVVSLLAVLELARLRVVRILQQESTGTFFLAQVEGAAMDDARHLNVTSAKQPESQQKPAQAEADAAVEPTVEPSTEAASETPGDVSAATTAELIADAELAIAELADDEDVDSAELPAGVALTAGEASTDSTALAGEEAGHENAATAATASNDPPAATAAIASNDPPAATAAIASDAVPAATAELAPSGTVADVVDPVAETPNVAEVIAAEDPDTALPAVELAAVEPSSETEDRSRGTESELATQPEPAVDASSPAQASDGIVETPTDAPVSTAETPADAPVARGDVPADDPISDGPREPVELRPQEEVISASSPASAATGEEATDGQPQEEQTTTEE